MYQNEKLEAQIQTMDDRILVLESTIHTILEELEVGTNGEFAGRIRKDLQSINKLRNDPSPSPFSQANMVFLLKAES